MVADTALFSHTQNSKRASWKNICLAPYRKIHEENNVLTDDELVIVRDFLKESKHACLYMRNEHPGGFKINDT